MPSEPTILLVGMSHKNMRASVGAIRARGYRVRELKSLPPGTRSLSGTAALESPPKGFEGPSWLPKRTRAVLAAIDSNCVAVVTRGGRRRGVDAALAARLRGVALVIKTEFDVYWNPTGVGLRERIAVFARRTVESLVIQAARVTRISPTRGPGRHRRHGGMHYLPHSVRVTLPMPPALPSLPLRVVTITRCPPGKNNEMLLDLAERVSRRDIMFTVVFGEDGTCKKCAGRGAEEFAASVEARGLACINVMEPLDDLTDLYRAHHVVFRNSLYEGANVTVIEGAAEGCIPILSKTCGAGYGLFDEGAGYLVDAENVEEQAAILVNLLEDIPLRERLREAAMTAVRDFCDPERFADIVEAVISRRATKSAGRSNVTRASSES